MKIKDTAIEVISSLAGAIVDPKGAVRSWSQQVTPRRKKLAISLSSAFVLGYIVGRHGRI